MNSYLEFFFFFKKALHRYALIYTVTERAKGEVHGFKQFFMLVFSLKFSLFPWKQLWCLSMLHYTYFHCSLPWIRSLDFKAFVASSVCKTSILRKYLFMLLSDTGFGGYKVITVYLGPWWHPKDLEPRAFLHLICWRLRLFKMDILLFLSQDAIC